MKTALIIRHVPREGVAGFRAPIEAAGYAIDRVDVTGDDFEALDLVAPDLVVMMGGPMGVYEREAHPWIACQLKLLARRLAADRPTLGVCFGAQMIAAALGAEVYPGPAKEIGFGAVALHDPASPLRHLADVPVLHWHGDTFTLPEGAELLASSPLYPHQAFRRGRKVLALQFHAEMGEDPRFDDWLEQDMDYLLRAGQCPEALRAAHATHGANAVAAGRAMIAEWLDQLG
ncbi:glutamine amidotransferase [Novosphingobium huizhouense]|uniref:glutamine amidotransferase n=1 Tax=Novosphingobium huizhouense TaxID=2866625 RepID=UPI001CD85751|nr:glutamine amidotransferase [Novosphingobium huizhouense]